MHDIVIHGDCLEEMKKIPDVHVDMILCDLPYGMTQCKWDTVIPLAPLWEQYLRVLKPAGVVALTAQQPFSSVLGSSNVEMLRYGWVWQKTAATGHLNAKRMPMKNHEDVLIFYREQPTYNPQGIVPFDKMVRRGGNGSCYGVSKNEFIQDNTNYPRTIVTFNKDGSRFHPTQKPVALFEYLIKTYTNEGDVVLDNCAGSGTTAIACINTNRRYICIEKEKEYIDVINKRIIDNA